ncbi:MAG TPA: hypothetical protein VG206_12665 [Terriglobia bacterium]|nr:hypothetical protein [Terriglobia bacterium]
MLERLLYPEVANWLARYLSGQRPRAKVSAHDTHSADLSAFLLRQGLHRHFPDYSAFEIQVDVTGVVEAQEHIELAFVECKVGPITLGDVGQLLGYSLVARPALSFLISPRGISDRLRVLLVTLGRQDILTYAPGRAIRLAPWDLVRREVDLSQIVPAGSHR